MVPEASNKTSSVEQITLLAKPEVKLMDGKPAGSTVMVTTFEVAETLVEGQMTVLKLEKTNLL